MKRPAAVAFLVLAVVGAFLSLAATQAPSGTGPTAARPFPGFAAPAFTLRSLAGKPVSLASLRGKPVLLNFWASWCPPCREEMPRIEQLQQAEGERVAIVGVDFREPAAVVQAFVARHGFTWTFLLDGEGSVTGAYDVRSFPTSFFLDQHGVIRQVYTGPMNLGQMRSFLRQTEAAH